MAPVYGFNGQLGIHVNTPVEARFDFQSADITLDEEIQDLSGMTGSREHPVSRQIAGLHRVGGSISLIPTSVELSNLLQWVFGGTPVTTSYPLADTIPAWYVTVGRDDGTDGKVFSYTGCLVNRAVFRASRGQPLSLDLDIVGSTETVGNAGTFPALSIDTTTDPFMFHDLVLSIASTGYSCDSFELTIDNMVDTERFFNSQNLSTSTNAQDRIISFRTSLPYGDAETVYNSGSAGVAVVATFTSGATSLAMTMAKVVFGRKTPLSQGKGEFMLPVDGVACESGGTTALATVLDSTP